MWNYYTEHNSTGNSLIGQLIDYRKQDNSEQKIPRINNKQGNEADEERERERAHSNFMKKLSSFFKLEIGVFGLC